MEGGSGKESGHGIPRVRVASPPSWLKNPSTQPGSIEGRLRHIDDSVSGTDAARNTHPALRQQLLHRKPEVEDFHYHLSHDQPRALKLHPSEPTTPSAGHKNRREDSSEATEKPTHSPRKTLDSFISPGHSTTTRRTTEATNTTAGSGVTAAIANARAMLGKRNNTLPPLDDHDHQPHTRQWLDDMQHRHRHHYEHPEDEEEEEVGEITTPPRQPRSRTGEREASSYIQRSRSRDRSLRQTASLKKSKSRASEISGERGSRRESDIRRARSLGVLRDGGGGRRYRDELYGSETRGYGDQEVEDDVGIRGLTIVLHLRGKDDLVISTDLTREVGSEGGGEGEDGDEE